MLSTKTGDFPHRSSKHITHIDTLDKLQTAYATNEDEAKTIKVADKAVTLYKE